MNYKKIIKRSLLALSLLIIIPGIIAFSVILFYKKELSKQLIDFVKTEYGLSAEVGKVKISLFENWPNATVKLTDVVLTCTIDNIEKKPFLVAGSLGVSFNLKKLLSKEFVVNSISIQNGTINLIKGTNETSNFKFRKPSEADSSKAELIFDLKKVNLRNVKFYFLNKPERKKINLDAKNITVKMLTIPSGIRANVQGELFSGGLVFNQSKGAFLKNKTANVDLNLNYFSKYRSVLFDKSYAIIDEQKYNVTAYAEFENKKRFILKVNSKNIVFYKSMTILNARIQQAMERFKIDNTIDVDALIVLRMGQKQDPQLLIKVSTNKNNITIGDSKIPYKNVSFSGEIVNPADTSGYADLSRARIVFKDVKGEVYDFPFKADVTIKNLRVPLIEIHGHLKIESSKIKFKAGKDFVLTGSCGAKIHYIGPLAKLNKEEFLNHPMILNADLNFKQFSYKANTLAPAYIVNGNAKVSNKDLKFANLQLKTVGGEFLLDGFAPGFTDYALGYSDGFKATLNASTNSFDLDPFLKKPTEESKKAKLEKKKKLSEANLSVFDFKISLSAKEFLVRKLQAGDISANLNYTKDILTINNLYMNTCEGYLQAKGTLRNLSDINAHVNLNDINIKTLFEQCENFGQKAIDSKNIAGTIGAKVDMNITLNEDYELLPQSMLGQVELKLKDGHLINFEPLQKISDYIFKNRNFEDITFTELDEVFKIKGYEMQIDNLEIASNVLNLYLNGVYNFKSQSNLNMRIPWSNLRRRGKNYIPKNLGKDGEDARGLKLNYSGLPKQMKLSLGNK